MIAENTHFFIRSYRCYSEFELPKIRVNIYIHMSVKIASGQILFYCYLKYKINRCALRFLTRN